VVKRILSNSLLKDTVVYGLSGTISKFIRVFLVPIYTRIFEPADYGIISLITVTTTIAGMLAVLGIDSATERFYWDTENENVRKSYSANFFWTLLVFSTAILVIAALNIDFISILLLRDAKYSFIILIGFGTMVLNTGIRVSTVWFRMRRLPVYAMFFSLSTALLNILLSILLVVFLRKGLVGVFTAQFISVFIMFVVSLFLLRDWINIKYFDFKKLKKMINYGLPLIPAAAGIWFIGSSNRYFLNYYHSAEVVGHYAVAFSVSSAVIIAVSSFRTAFSPYALSKLDDNNHKKLYSANFIQFVVIGAILCLGTGVFSQEIILILATESYLPAAPIVGILAFGYLINGIGSFAALGPAIIKKTASVGYSVIIATVINFILNIVLIKHYAHFGAAISMFITWLVWITVLFASSQKLYYIPFRFFLAILVISAGLLLTYGINAMHFSSLVVQVGTKLTFIIGVIITALLMLKKHVKRLQIV